MQKVLSTGRPVTAKTYKVRGEVARVMAKRIGEDMTTVEVARLARQGKYPTLVALRFFEKQGYVSRRGYRKDTSGPGQPAVVWYSNASICD